MSTTAIATFWLAARLLAAQGEAPPPAPAPAPVEQPALVPGALPANASEPARAAWTAMCKATAGAAAQAPVTGFELYFDGRARPVGREVHDFDDTRFRYLEPGWLETSMKDGATRVRGPRGNYFVRNGVVTRLQGQDYAVDLRELDEQARVAHSFVSLIDPRRLRLASLALVQQPPPVIPPSLAERTAQLRWLEVVSPDFHTDAPTAANPRPARAWIGLDAKTNLPQLAIVASDERGAIVHETALLVKVDKWTPLDGFQVPGELRSYSPDLTRSPWTFAETPSLTLWLKRGSLRPTLGEKDFVPPEKR